jgi:ankyrin repeat protein
MNHLDVVRCLIMEFRADVHQITLDGVTLLHVAVKIGHFDLARCMVNELGFDISQASTKDGAKLLLEAIWLGNLDMVRFLVKELRADINQTGHDGFTALMCTTFGYDQALIKHLVHKGANVRAVSKAGSKAITVLTKSGSTTAQITYLKVREYCANPGCDGGGRKRCCVCKETRYCGMACRVVHWRVHRECCCQPPIVAELGSA